MSIASKSISIIAISALMISAHSFSAKLFLEDKKTLIANCPNSINIMIDTEGITTNTVDVKLIKNQDYQISNLSYSGAVFGSYSKSLNAKIRQGKHKGSSALYILGTNPWIGNFNGKGKFASLSIIPQHTGSLKIDFYMIPNYNWDDSNISYIKWWKVLDALDKVINGNFQVTVGECPIIPIKDKDFSIPNKEYYFDHQKILEEKNMLLDTSLLPDNKIEIISHIIEHPHHKNIREIIKLLIQKLFK